VSAIGAMTFTGSVIAFLKLSARMSRRADPAAAAPRHQSRAVRRIVLIRHLVPCGTGELDCDQYDRGEQREIDDVASGSRIGAPLMRAGQLQEPITEPVNVIGADRDTERHLDQAAAVKCRPACRCRTAAGA